MAYWTNEKMVVDAAEFFAALEKSLARGQPLKISLRGLDCDSTKERYRVRQLIVAAARHPRALEGRYRHLAALTRVSYDALAEEIIISPTNSRAIADMLASSDERPRGIDPEILADLAAHGMTPEDINLKHKQSTVKKKGISMLPKFDPSTLEKDDE